MTFLLPPGIKGLKDLNKLSLKMNTDLEEFIRENACFIKRLTVVVIIAKTTRAIKLLQFS